MTKIFITKIVGDSDRFVRRLKQLVPALVLLALATGCQTQTPLPPATRQNTNATEIISLREGDVLKISFPANANLNTTQPIRRDGMISMPLIGEVKAVGKTPAELEKEEIKNYITDERGALNLFGDGVVYHSQAFTEATEISGFVKLVVWMSLDVPDTDFSVALYEIMPDGKSIQLTDDTIRARYRDSATTEKLAKPGEINRYEFNGFTFFSRQVAKGSRLRLVLTSPNSIYLEKNYNSGGVVAEESGKDAHTAHIRLYHDSDHPSALELPLVK